MNDLQEKLSLAFRYFDTHQYEKAEQLYNECFATLNANQTDQYKQVLFGMGYVKCGLKKFEEASKMYRTLKMIAQQESNVEEEMIAVHQLGMVERMAEHYTEALSMFDEELRIMELNNLQNPLYCAANFYEKGYIHMLIKEYSNAEHYLNLALHHAQLSGDLISIACAYRSLGEVFQQKKSYNQAHHYFAKAKQLFVEAGDLEGVKEINRFMKTITKL